MNWPLIKAILILPGTVLIYVPVIVLWAAAGTSYSASVATPATASFWIAAVFAGCGLALAAWTVRLFARFGDGTPAPWNPPERLVVRGPYRHVRNPMITAVLLMLAGEALMLRSWPLAGWMVLFFAVNAVYFPLSEEKGLEGRFGDDYRAYKAHVPRWIPRLRPWHGA